MLSVPPTSHPCSAIYGMRGRHYEGTSLRAILPERDRLKDSRCYCFVADSIWIECIGHLPAY